MAVNIAELNNAERIFMDYLLPRIGPSSGEHVSFVQIGANVSDVEGDPIFRFVNAGLWKGLLVEPLPHVFDELKQKTAHIEGLTYANTAISDEPGTKTIYYPEGRTVLASFDPAVPRSHYPNSTIELEELEVPCDTLEGIIASHGIEQFDVLVTDTEGHDAQILLNTDLTKVRASTIIFEAKHLSAEDRQAVANHLQKAGYIVIEMGANTLAVRAEGESVHFYNLIKGIFAQFRTMEARSMTVMMQLANFSNSVLNSTPRS